MGTFVLIADDLTAEIGLSVRLRPMTLASAVANGAGGDTLTEDEDNPGLFTATVAEALTGLHRYFVYQNGAPIYEGKVYCVGSIWVADDDSWLLHAGAGSNAVTVTVTSGASAVPGAIVIIRSGSTLVAWGNADSSGEAVFNLQDGDYTATVQSQPGYEPHTAIDFSTPEDAAVAITLTQQSITPASTPGLCTVRFLVLDSGTPVAGANVTVELEDINPMVDMALLVRTKHVGTTDEDGILDVTMVQFDAFTRGGVYKVLVSDPNGRTVHSRRVKVPASASLYAEDLLDASS